MGCCDYCYRYECQEDHYRKIDFPQKSKASRGNFHHGKIMLAQPVSSGNTKRVA